MATLLDLAKRLEKKADSIDKAVNDLTINTALTVIRDLAYVTPVDTSNAISNWQASLNSPVTMEISPHYMGSRGSTYAQSAGETVALATAVLSDRKLGQPIYIVNNAPYIRDLNNGTSTQAPAGFVQRSVLIGRNYIKQNKLKVK